MTHNFQTALRTDSQLRDTFVRALAQRCVLSGPDIEHMKRTLESDARFNRPLLVFARPPYHLKAELGFLLKAVAPVIAPVVAQAYVLGTSSKFSPFRQSPVPVNARLSETKHRFEAAQHGLLLAAADLSDRWTLTDYVTTAIESDVLCVLLTPEEDFRQFAVDPVSMPILDRLTVCSRRS